MIRAQTIGSVNNMKILIHEDIIDKCADCYHHVWVISEKEFCCDKKKLRNIEDTDTIPEWCPLKTAKEW